MTRSSFYLVPGLLVLLFLLSGCSGDADSDAFGNFEATEVTVSAQADGQLLSLELEEGSLLDADQIVGRVDTTQLVAQRDVLNSQVRQLQAQERAMAAQEAAARAQIGEAEAMLDGFRSQLRTVTTERDRTLRMFEAGAATDRELQDFEGKMTQVEAQVRQAESRLAATGAQVEAWAAQRRALAAQVDAVQAQIRQVLDRLNRTEITSPRAGTVLSVLVESGELVRTGSPVFTLADLDPMTLRVYVSGDQLPLVRLGDTADVRVDDGDGGLLSLPGAVAFIASEAEFTPSTIQTRDARADLVYAVEIRVDNPAGRLKRGMPGEVRFARPDGQE